jgi:peptidoglycan hydrolase-like protein with peptidoglycan-binding domain
VRRTVVIVVTVAAALALSGPAVAAQSAKVAALQVALRAKGLYDGSVDGISGPMTRTALLSFQRKHGIRATGKVGYLTRCKLGLLGKPLLGQRQLSRGRVGWDVASLEFRLRKYGLARKRIDGRFDAATGAALRAFQRAHGLSPDGIAGTRTFRALARPRTVVRRAPARPRPLVHVVRPGEGFIVIARRYRVGAAKLANSNGLRLASVLTPGQRLVIPGRAVARKAATKRAVARVVHAVQPGESFFSIAQTYHVSPWRLARVNDLSLMATIVPGQRLALPRGAHLASSAAPVDRDVVRAAIDRWARTYGVDSKLARALAWMESGFQQDVVSSAGAVGVMQLLPETWQWVDAMLLGGATPRTYDGNVRAGVRYLRWQLDQFDGDVKLALAGYYQGARAVRERGLFEDTKQYVSVILQLYGSV